ncbi:DUF3311 domain-containing protein [Bryocella elongata]|uniref:DUF3311 domain-containing protein n=1 Tax=Bryocella elongata TaxID=863522 RepID=UPI000CDF19D8|nr:DUF3311 domain-containing protein [Bryocella elongata]
MSERSRPRRSTVQKAFIAFLLALPYVFLCFPQMYNRATPVLLGFPFFYWYQLGWVILTSSLLWVVYLQLRTE